MPVSFSRTEEAVISDFDESVWQHVLEKATDELFGLKRHPVPLALVILVEESRVPVLKSLDAAI